MHPQLQQVAREFRDAHARLLRLANSVDDELWIERLDPERWSISECVAHLTLTGAAYVPLLRDVIERARQLGGAAPARYRRDVRGWLLWRMMRPPVRFGVQTTAPFVPSGQRPRSELLKEFEELQEAQIACVTESDGLPLGQVRITSPFNPRLQYNLFACFTILSQHQHRHLWQAERLRIAFGRQQFLLRRPMAAREAPRTGIAASATTDAPLRGHDYGYSPHGHRPGAFPRDPFDFRGGGGGGGGFHGGQFPGW